MKAGRGWCVTCYARFQTTLSGKFLLLPLNLSGRTLICRCVKVSLLTNLPPSFSNRICRMKADDCFQTIYRSIKHDHPSFTRPRRRQTLGS
ncbi:hypothetical protein NEIMUCOT_06269 [Neisseria mucosa ATCC 25996]|uniref:Uncharacterized protein n=1 Tax=Neisseria mucosa (strain ATCC 25996 / DSM 4631 / NCTC 10774 / M26) TaxID=546266 RepID=D3A034_NEIM2|nr:hypothetical protein NEIMUCOT_06269 [Neisseria mucosa ATCC 25996]